MRDEGKYCSLLFLRVSAAKKPNIDRLAAPGMLLETTFVSIASADPAGPLILTGKHSQQNGFMDNGGKFDDDQ